MRLKNLFQTSVPEFSHNLSGREGGLAPAELPQQARLELYTTYPNEERGQAHLPNPEVNKIVFQDQSSFPKNVT
jgi:hypothetical protein